MVPTNTYLFPFFANDSYQKIGSATLLFDARFFMFQIKYQVFIFLLYF